MIIANIGNSLVKRYRFTIFEISPLAPTQIIIENTLGGEIIWTRDGIGFYIGTLDGAFPEGKTFITPQQFTDNFSILSSIIRATDNTIHILASDDDCFPAEGLLVTIEVYP